MKLPAIHLPKVHIAVNIAGLLSVIGSAAAFVTANPSAPTAVGLPAKDAAAAVAIAGVIAAFLPTKAQSTGK